MVDDEVIGALERTGNMTPQHMMLIDTILTMPGDTVEKEHQRRIAAIKAVIAFCDVEEGMPSRQKRPAADAPPSEHIAKRRECSPRVGMLFLKQSHLSMSHLDMIG